MGLQVAKVRTLTLPTIDGIDRATGRAERGFTLLELMVALAIAGFFIGVAVPGGWKMYESMQYRKAVRDVTAVAAAARYGAITSGVSRDVVMEPGMGRYRLGRSGEEPGSQQFRQLPDSVSMSAETAAEVSPGPQLAAIRFYPDGSSSGGSISISRSELSPPTGVRLRVDWLLGRVTQEPL